MVGRTTPLNSSQRITTLPINIRRVVSPYTFYLCPTGKKAKIKGSAVCTGLGAAASVRLNVAGTRIVEWQAVATSSKVLAINTYFYFEIQLAAGETLDYTQDAGTNGELNIFAEYQETDA